MKNMILVIITQVQQVKILISMLLTLDLILDIQNFLIRKNVKRNVFITLILVEYLNHHMKTIVMVSRPIHME